MEKKFETHRQNTKLLATALLDFADMNEAEIKSHHGETLEKVSGEVDEALELIES